MESEKKRLKRVGRGDRDFAYMRDVLAFMRDVVLEKERIKKKKYTERGEKE